ncbi:MAG: MFS transporter [Gemmataceae bacterium]
MVSERPSSARYLVLAWFCALAMLAYVQRNSLAVPAKQVARDLDIGVDDMDAVLGMFFWGYAALQVPAGWLGWRFGSRAVVPLVILVCSAANALQALATDVSSLLTLRFVMGMAQAALFPCAVQSFAAWFPPAERAMPSGWLAAFMSVGGALALALTGGLLDLLSWQALMVVYAAPGLVCAVWFYVWFRDTPAQHGNLRHSVIVSAPSLQDARTNDGIQRARGEAPTSGDANGPVSVADAAPPSIEVAWYQVLFTPDALLVYLQQFCRAAAYIFYATMWPLFLQDGRGLRVAESGYVGSLPLLGVVFGSACGGQVMDWVYRRTGSVAWSRRGVALANLSAAALFMVLGYLCVDVWLTVLFLTISSVCAGACGPAAYTATIDLGGRHVATVFSVMNMSGNIGAALLPTAVIAVKDVHGWNSVLLLLAGLYVVSAVCWLLVRLPGALPGRHAGRNA